MRGTPEYLKCHVDGVGEVRASRILMFKSQNTARRFVAAKCQSMQNQKSWIRPWHSSWHLDTSAEYVPEIHSNSSNKKADNVLFFCSISFMAGTVLLEHPLKRIWCQLSGGHGEHLVPSILPHLLLWHLGAMERSEVGMDALYSFHLCARRGLVSLQRQQSDGGGTGRGAPWGTVVTSTHTPAGRLHGVLCGGREDTRLKELYGR